MTVAKKLVILVVATPADSKFGKVPDEFDAAEPLDLLEAMLRLVA
jgi:hypothetical protein